MSPWRFSGDVALGVAVFALGSLLAMGAARIPEPPSSARVGPRLFPMIVAFGLAACGLALTIQAARSAVARAGPYRRRVPGFLLFGLAGHVVFLVPFGFVPAATLLFALTARGFGSRRLFRDLLAGAALAIVCYIVFTRGLDRSLPAGVLSPVS